MALSNWMKDGIKIGLTGEQRQVVEVEHLIDFMGPDVPGVLATAWLVRFMEHAARNAISPYMEDDEDSVGTEVAIEHTAPTPVGFEVRCRARVIYVDGRKITFEIRADDGVEPVGRATHKRAVVKKSRLARRIEQKLLESRG